MAGTQTDSPSRRRLTSAMMALILLLIPIGLVWGGYAYWKSMGGGFGDARSSSFKDVPTIGPQAGGGGGGGGRGMGWGQMAQGFAASLPDGVMSTPMGYRVKAKGVRMDVDRPGGHDWRYRFFYTDGSDAATADEKTAFTVRTKAVRETAMAEKLGVKAEQIAQLRDILPGGMVVDPADKDQLKKLFMDYLQVSGRPTTTAPSVPVQSNNSPEAKTAEQQIVTTLAAIGAKQLQPTLQYRADCAKRITNVLGADLFAKLKTAG